MFYHNELEKTIENLTETAEILLKRIETLEETKEHRHCARCGFVVGIRYDYYNKDNNPVCKNCVFKMGLKAIKK